MIELRDISLRRGPEPLLKHTGLRIGPGWHLGVTGRNGSGKSSLLEVINGELEAEDGVVSVPSDWRIAVMEQEVPGSDRGARDYILDGHELLRAAERKLEEAQDADDGHAIAEAHVELEQQDAWSAPARAASMMIGLGFATADLDRPLSDFSGGWRMRLNIARILMADADLLLLDEPTNHLDLDAVLWLQDMLARSPATILLISHDRGFLDAVVGHIVHIEDRKLHYFKGTFSQSQEQRARERAQQQQQHDKQQAEIARVQAFIDRFRAKANKARQAQSRIKALEKMERVAPVRVESGFQFRFASPARVPDPMIRLDDAATGYHGQALLSGINLSLHPHTRLGLLGPNGAGKSTLIRFLSGQLESLGGEEERHPDLVVGYFEQHQVDALPAEATPLGLLREQCPDLQEQFMRDFLGGFGFRGDDVNAPVRNFSGGEKSRLALALLVRRKPALLLLDEPTNHLDMDMREALATALGEFEGAVVIIAHDRHLLDATVDEFLLVHDGGVEPWDGNLDDYAGWLRRRPAEALPKAEPTPAPEPEQSGPGRERRREAAQKRAEVKPLQDRVARLEKEMAGCQAELEDIEQQLSDSGLYGDDRKDELTDLLGRQAEQRQQYEQLEAQLLEAMEALEHAQQEAAG